MRVFGDPDRFAIGHEFRKDPDSGGDPLARASLGALQLWVAGRNLTSGRTDDGRTVEAAEVPLALIVQWLLRNWDPLFHEERLPRPLPSKSAAAWRMDVLQRLPESEAELDVLMIEGERWWQRHGLGSAVPESRIPDLQLRRRGDQIEASWDDREWRSVPGGVRLIEPPDAVLLPADEVGGVAYEWATACVDELEKRRDCPVFVEEARVLLKAIAQPASVVPRLEWAAGQDIRQAAIHLRRQVGVTNGAVDDTIRVLLGVETSPVGLVTPLTVPVLLFRSAKPHLSHADLANLLGLARDLPVDDGRAGGRPQRPRLAKTPVEIGSFGGTGPIVQEGQCHDLCLLERRRPRKRAS
jgi:hypothetical protein